MQLRHAAAAWCACVILVAVCLSGYEVEVDTMAAPVPLVDVANFWLVIFMAAEVLGSLAVFSSLLRLEDILNYARCSDGQMAGAGRPSVCPSHSETTIAADAGPGAIEGILTSAGHSEQLLVAAGRLTPAECAQWLATTCFLVVPQLYESYHFFGVNIAGTLTQCASVGVCGVGMFLMRNLRVELLRQKGSGRVRLFIRRQLRPAVRAVLATEVVFLWFVVLTCTEFSPVTSAATKALGGSFVERGDYQPCSALNRSYFQAHCHVGQQRVMALPGLQCTVYDNFLPYRSAYDACGALASVTVIYEKVFSAVALSANVLFVMAVGVSLSAVSKQQSKNRLAVAFTYLTIAHCPVYASVILLPLVRPVTERTWIDDLVF